MAVSRQAKKPAKLQRCIIYIPILVEWLNIVDLSLMDSALTNHRMRQVFLEYIDFDRCIMDGLKSVPLSASFLHWTKLRSIAVRDINLACTPVLYPETTLWNFWDSEMVSVLSCELFPGNAKYCSKVRSLTLTNTHKIHPDLLLDHHHNNGLSSLPSLVHCTNLRELTLVEYSFGMEANIFYIPGTASVSVPCPNTTTISANLVSLDLRSCYEVSFEAISYVLDHCTRLSSLAITHVQPAILHNRYRRGSAAKLVPRACPQLTTLDLSHCGRLWDGTLTALVDRCNYLLNINVQHCSVITDFALEHLAKRCLCLLEFDCSACASLTDTGVIALVSGCHFLQKVNLSHNWVLRDASILTLSENCHHLTSLNISDCYQITDAAITELCACCEELRELFCDHCISIGDASVTAIGQHCSHFTALSAASCCNITNIAALSASCSRLRALCMSEWPSVVDADVISFVQHSPHLVRLDLSRCPRVTDASLCAIAAHCPLLEELTTTDCINVTDAGVIAVVRACRRLVLLDMENCLAITYDSIDAANLYAKQLRELRVHEIIADIVPCENHFTHDAYWSCQSFD